MVTCFSKYILQLSDVTAVHFKTVINFFSFGGIVSDDTSKVIEVIQRIDEILIHVNVDGCFPPPAEASVTTLWNFQIDR